MACVLCSISPSRPRIGDALLLEPGGEPLLLEAGRERVTRRWRRCRDGLVQRMRLRGRQRERVHRGGAPVRLLDRRPQVRRCATDGCRRIVQLVRQPGSECAERDELLLLHEQGLGTAQPGVHRPQHGDGRGPARRQQMLELGRRHYEQLAVAYGSRRRVARLVAEQRHLANELAGARVRDDDLAAGLASTDLQLAGDDDVEAVAGAALLHDHVACRNADAASHGTHLVQIVFRQLGEERVPSQDLHGRLDPRRGPGRVHTQRAMVVTGRGASTGPLRC
jgi:hypothetical protein